MKELLQRGRSLLHSRPGALVGVGLCLLLVATGCSSTPTNAYPPVEGEQPQFLEKPQVLQIAEGDVLTITFPSTPTLNSVQKVQRDGKINLAEIGEVMAAGKTTGQLEKAIQLAATNVISKEVRVGVQSSSFSVYVTGAVLRPGEITTDRPITAVQAVMKAGVDHSKANLKSVKITRTVGSQTEHYRLNIRAVLEGKESPPFYLKPGDIVYVPERFSPF